MQENRRSIYEAECQLILRFCDVTAVVFADYSVRDAFAAVAGRLSGIPLSAYPDRRLVDEIHAALLLWADSLSDRRLRSLVVLAPLSRQPSPEIVLASPTLSDPELVRWFVAVGRSKDVDEEFLDPVVERAWIEFGRELFEFEGG